MAQRVEVTVADIVRSFAKGVIGERIAVRKLEALMQAHVDEAVREAGTPLTLGDLTQTYIDDHPELVIHTDNL
jgi:hypothetical protein